MGTLIHLPSAARQFVDASGQVGDGLPASVRHYAGLANEAAHRLTYLPLPISGLDRRTNT